MGTSSTPSVDANVTSINSSPEFITNYYYSLEGAHQCTSARVGCTYVVESPLDHTLGSHFHDLWKNSNFW